MNLLPESPDCLAFAETAQAVLDGDAPLSALEGAHAAGCPECRRHAAAVRVLLAGLKSEPVPTVSAGFADRVVKAALRERRVRAFRRAGVGLAVAAGVLAAVFLSKQWAGPAKPHVPSESRELVKAPAPPRVEEQFAEAGSALAALTRRTADETMAPARDLIPAVEPPTVAQVVFVPADAEPAVESLAEFPQAAQAGFEPVADTARRAVNLFLRDTGIFDMKPNS